MTKAMATRKSTGTTKAPRSRKRKPPGQPPAITPEIQEKLCNLLSLGMYVEPSCRALGLSPTTYYRWRAEGEEAEAERVAAIDAGQEPPKLEGVRLARWEFWEATEKAVGLQESAYLQLIAAAASGGSSFTETKRVVEHVRDKDGKVVDVRVISQTDTTTVMKPAWQAAAWILERRHPDQWGRRERIELTGAQGGPIEATVNAGAKALEDPEWAGAVDSLLDGLVGHHETLPE